MNKLKQNEAIARHLGWKQQVSGKWGRMKNGYQETTYPPDYTHSLNEINEAEESLHGEDWARYFDLIQRTGNATGVRATASQRAEAFLKTIGKWEEE